MKLIILKKFEALELNEKYGRNLKNNNQSNQSFIRIFAKIFFSVNTGFVMSGNFPQLSL